MKFLVDAHLPRRLAHRLQKLGHDAIHTLDLPLANQTPDSIIEEISWRERRIVVTKDSALLTPLRSIAVRINYSWSLPVLPQENPWLVLLPDCKE